MSASKPTPATSPVPPHTDPLRDDRLSYAPYNFVPLPSGVLAARSTDAASSEPWRHHDEYLPGTHSGWIDLAIRAETPLYVRCAPAADAALPEEPRENRARQDFFHRGDPEWPVIPGSSLRGMMRSLVEILAAGSLREGWFSDRRLIYRAVGDTTSLGIAYRDTVLGPNQDTMPKMRFEYPISRLRGGYLRKRGPEWFIQPARSFHGETFVHVEYKAVPWAGHHDPAQDYGPADVIDVLVRSPVKRTTPPRKNKNLVLRMAHIGTSADIVPQKPNVACPPDFVPGVLVRSGHMAGKTEKHMHCVLYEPDPDAALIPIGRPMWEHYEDDRELSRGFKTRPLKNDGSPLFYLVQQSGGKEPLEFFGPTMMFRLLYPHGTTEFIPPAVRQPPDIDLAEALFGRVTPQPAIKGRVFVEDACWDEQGGCPFLESGDAGRRTPWILGTPKPTAFQHYLVQPDVGLPDGSPAPAGDDRKTLCNYHHPLGKGPYVLTDHEGRRLAETDGTVIRGYKRYWHQGQAKDEERFLSGLVRNEDRRPEFKGWKQLTIIRPVKKETVFVGRVRFENLTDMELGALLTVLQLEKHQRHQIGMGKPLGMGSIRIETTLHLTDRKARYARLFQDTGRVELGEKDAKEIAADRIRCRAAFARVVWQHHHLGPMPDSPDIWSIPRLRALAALLDWDHAPSVNRIGYAPPDNDPRNPLKWWRERPVLPTAEFVAGLPAAPAAPASPTTPQPRPAQNLGTGHSVLCVLLDEKTKGGSWKAIVKDTEVKGDILGTAPPDASAGQELTLVVRYFTPPRTAGFYWPDSAPAVKPAKPKPRKR